MSLLLTLAVLAQLGGLPHRAHVRPPHAPARRGVAPVAPALSPAAPADDVPAIVSRARLDTASVNFRALVLPETVYVGQQATYQLGVFVEESVRDRLRRMEAMAPEMRSMLAYDPPAPASGFPERALGERHYDVHVYQRPIFPLAAGRFVIPPARLVYAMPLTYSFFSREESFEARSDSVVLVAIEPPQLGRPPDYAGAVGHFTLSLHLDSPSARVGDPVTLTVRVSGTGNVQLLPRPPLVLPWATAVPAGERVALDPDSLTIHGSKEFDWVVTPSHAGRVALAGVRYPFWNPAALRYEIAAAPPESVTVDAGVLATLDSIGGARPPLALRDRDRGPLNSPLYLALPLWWLLGAAPFPALVLLARRVPRPTRRRRPRGAALRALARDPARPATSRSVRRAFLDAVAERIRVPAVRLAEPSALARALRRAGTPGATAAAAADLLAALNEQAFARGAADGPAPDAAERAYRVYRAVDDDACRLDHTAVRVLGVLLALAAIANWGLAADGGALHFARGVDAYGHARFKVAAAEFAAITAAAPRDADAWANLGTAAWEASDTARASLGWQRALRLEPTADDVRERLEQVAPASGRGPSAVPTVPPLPLALGAALLWLLAWGGLAVGLRTSRGRRTARVALPALAVACLMGAAAGALDQRLAARDLAVIGSDVPLRLAPALSAERASTLRTGEVARLLARDGAWARVLADGDRDGWIDASLLLPLSRD